MSWNFFCADMFPYEDSKTVSVCLSVCLSVRLSVCLSVRLSVCPSVRTTRNENPPVFVNISPTLVIDTSMERSSRVLQQTQKFDFFLKSSKFEFWLVMKSWNHLSFVNISPTLVNDTSIERSSRVLHHGNLKNWIFSKKVRNSNFDLWRRAEITLASSISVPH